MNKILAVLVLALYVCGCTRKEAAADRPLLMVSIEPQKWILEQLVGDDYAIGTMLDRGANPETFDPSMEKRLQADKATAYFSTGAFPFEESLAKSLPDRTRIVNTSDGIEPIYGTHSHTHNHTSGHSHGHDCDHHGEAADPHMWTSLKNARIIARNMAEALADLDSAEAATVNRRLATLEQRLDSIDKATANRLEGASRSFAIWHPSLSYYARDYGLNQIAVGQESKEMPAGQVRQVIDNARNANVKVFFFQKEYDNRQAESINSAIGSRMITIDPLAYDWLGQIELITNEIARP
jgi:zinc transport system substrate-binding protein